MIQSLDAISSLEDIDFEYVLRVLQNNIPDLISHVLEIEKLQKMLSIEMSDLLNFMDDDQVNKVITALSEIKKAIPDTPQMNQAFANYCSEIVKLIQMVGNALRRDIAETTQRLGEVTAQEAQLRANINRLTGNTYVEKPPVDES